MELVRKSDHTSGSQQHAKDSNPLSPSVQEVELADITKSRSLGQGPPTSPAKGILLTPGAAATKRKTVSFGSLEADGSDQKADLLNHQTSLLARAAEKVPASNLAHKVQDPHAAMTKSSFENQLATSKRRIQRRTRSSESALNTNDGQSLCRANPDRREDALTGSTDITVDLDVPRSRSGKHWKGEYDQYHRKTNREMRRMIQHGQTIRSYAQRKDLEASSLRRKLDTELSKVASMEEKVSRLAIELSKSREHGDDSDINQTQLVSNLAKQTATAIRHKQKAEKYQAALAEDCIGSSKKTREDYCQRGGTELSLTISESANEKLERSEEFSQLFAELELFRSASATAERRAAGLAKENMSLKQNLARVKFEMQNYESRRLAREERIKKRETKLIAAREESEAKAAHLEMEHRKLLRWVRDGHRADKASATDSGQDVLEMSLESSVVMGESKEPHSPSCYHAAGPTARIDCIKSHPGDIDASIEYQTESRMIRPRSPLVQLKNPASEEPNVKNHQVKDQRRSATLAAKECCIEEAPSKPAEVLEDDFLRSQMGQDSNFSLLRRSTHAALRKVYGNSLSEQMNGPQTPAYANVGPVTTNPSINRTNLSSALQSKIPSPRPPVQHLASHSPDVALNLPRPILNGHLQGKKSSLLSQGMRSSMTSSRSALPPARVEAAQKRLEAKKQGKRMKELSTRAANREEFVHGRSFERKCPSHPYKHPYNDK